MVGDSLLKINNAAKPDALKTFLDEKTQSLAVSYTHLDVYKRQIPLNPF